MEDKLFKYAISAQCLFSLVYSFSSLAFEANYKNREHLGFYIHLSNSFAYSLYWGVMTKL